MFIAFGKLKSLHKQIANSAYKNQTEKILYTLNFKKWYWRQDLELLYYLCVSTVHNIVFHKDMLVQVYTVLCANPFLLSPADFSTLPIQLVTFAP